MPVVLSCQHRSSQKRGRSHECIATSTQALPTATSEANPGVGMSHVDKVAAAIKGVLSHADYKRGNLVEMQGALPACSDLLANAKILRAVLPLQVVPSAEEGCTCSPRSHR